VVALSVLATIDAIGGAPIYQSLHRLTGEAVRPDIAMVKVSLATYALALLIWPVSLILSRLYAPGFVIPLLVLATVVTSKICSSDACLLALLAGGLIWLLVRYAGSIGAKVLVVLVALPFVLAPLAVMVGGETGVIAWLHRLVPASWDARLNIWTFAADHIQAHPFRGWGLDASRTFGPAIPLHTHNAQLQLWLELGGVGAALAGVFFCWLAYGVVRISEKSRGEAAMAAGALVSYLVIGGLSFGVWQEWWLGLGALTLIACGLARAIPGPAWGELDELTPLG
jgi:O-antigen ligase